MTEINTAQDTTKKTIYDFTLDDNTTVNILEVSDNYDAITALETTALEQIQRIGFQLTAAKARAAVDGFYSDRAWYKSASICLQAKKHQLSIIRKYLSKFRRQNNDKSCQAKYLLYKCFHDECIRVLKPETIKLITDQVKYALKLDSLDGFLE